MAREFQIQGTEAVLKKLKALADPKQQRSAVRSAGTGAMKIVRDAARSKAKTFDDTRSPELIAKNIVTSFRARRSKGNQIVVSVGVMGGARDMTAYGEIKGKGSGNPGGDTWYWRFKEFGVPEHGIPADPFMRPAMDENVEKVTEAFVAELSKRIDKIIAKGKL